jgi:hypothetical protein
MVVGPDGVATWVAGEYANCGRCGHTSEYEYMSKTCNDCLFNWGVEYTDINALTPRFKPVWTFTADAMFIGREVFNDVNYQRLRNNGPFVLNTETAFPFEIAAGVRGKVSRGIGEAFRVEAIYTGQLSWDHKESYRDITPNTPGGIGTMTSPFTSFGNPIQVPGLDFNTLAEIGYTSELENFELNLIHREGLLCCALETAFVCGVRYATLDETFRYLTYANAPAPLGALNIIDTDTTNELIGGQLGVLSAYKITDWAYFEFELKAALCQNFATQNTFYRNINTVGGTLNVNASRTDAGDGNLAVIGDINLILNCQLTEAITFRLGYYAMFIDGLAIAHENVTDNFGRLTLGPGFLNDHGSIVLHGPHVGWTVNW